MAGALGYLVGMLIGGLIGIFLLYSLWEFALFKRIFSDPVVSKLSAVVTAYLSGSIIAGLGNADSGSFAWNAFLQYLVPALIVGGLAFRHAIKLRADMHNSAVVKSAFD